MLPHHTEQDDALLQISKTVGALKRTSYAISDELTLQNGMLDSLGTDVDRTQGSCTAWSRRAPRWQARAA